MSRRVVRGGLALAVPVLALLLVRAFLFDVYLVDSGSMEPVIHGSADGGEHVLVRYARAPELERFALVVVLREGARVPAVKRVVGLPGEELRIVGGDLRVDGERLPPGLARPAAVSVFDSDLQGFEDDFELDGAWTDDGRSLELKAKEGREGRACWRHALTDDWVTVEGDRIQGKRQVGDAVLECRVFSDAITKGVTATILLSLSEEGDVFEAVIRYLETNDVEVSLLRRVGEKETILASRTVARANLRRARFRLSNVDDHVALDVDGERLLEASYERNTPLEGGPDPKLRHLRPRACFGGRDVRASFRDVRLQRDLHYTERGTFGTAEAVRLGPREVFLLGDNSGESVDGREWGPVSLDEIIGIPVAVIWPFAAARPLASVAPVPGPATQPASEQ